MNCYNCGLPLPAGTTTCPRCGAYMPPPSTPAGGAYLVSNPGVPPSPQAQPSRPPLPPTYYGADPYSSPSPYAPPPPPFTPVPPPTTPPRQQAGLIVVLVVLAVIVIGGGILFLIARPFSGPSQADANATATAIARAGTATPATTPTSAATPTATAATDQLPNPYPPKTGTLVLNDPMHDNSKGYRWTEAPYTFQANGATVTGNCGFKESGYHVTIDKQAAFYCLSTTLLVTSLKNLAYEAKVTIVQGDFAGIIAKAQDNGKKGYLFGISLRGEYAIATFDSTISDPQKQIKILRAGTNAVIKQGKNQANLAAIVINERTISVYANGVYLDSVQDTTYSAGGQIGVYCESDSAGSGADIMATDAHVWKL
ncbi:MAG: hypothetical protein IMW89_07590 [Ktedonobacteraceae bacterium]|nr:hypothetical protein [Ktedonobacteraceae bacterium]